MYKQLVSSERLRQSTEQGRSLLKEVESDKGRVVFSAPFRRMQSKAQVFSLESNAAVRSRLTHSMEVAHIGRYIVQEIKRIEDNKSKQGLLVDFSEMSSLVETIVETSCLLHDIGNPPFGHLGEKAIQEWFEQHSNELHIQATGKDIDKKNSRYMDFANFDGNPQGVRIVTNLQGDPGKHGLNLTCTQIASLIKYPRKSIDNESKYKKIGIFTSEYKQVDKVWDVLGLDWGIRHPLVYLMEAADDIAYNLSDIEDGIEKRIVDEEKVISSLVSNFNELGLDNFVEYLKPKGEQIVSNFVAFRTKMIGELVIHAAESYIRNHESIVQGDQPSIFDKENDDKYSMALKSINDYCRDTFYSSAEAEDIEIAGYNIVYGLLEKFSILLAMPSDDFQILVSEMKGKDLQRRMFSKFPSRWVEHYKIAISSNPNDEWFIRVQLLVDYISGMTDDFALKVHKLLHGIEIKVI